MQLGEPVSSELTRIIQGKVDTGIKHIDIDLDRHETVHEVRKRCKEVRAALRLVRGVVPTYSDENAHYRDAARRLSDIRDSQALIETFDDHVAPAAEQTASDDAESLQDLRESLVDPRDTLAAEQDLGARLTTVRADLVDGRRRIDSLPIATEGYDAIEGGLRKPYKRARNGMEEAYDDPEAERFHEWRKRVKYHRYHSRLLRQVWVGPMTHDERS